jgi:predicted metal-dependent peptidase
MATIEAAMLRALIYRPYYAMAINALTIVKSKDVDTFAVDKFFRLYYNESFLESLDDKTAGNIISGHEIEHLLRDHNARAEFIGATGKRFNIAGDMAINDDLPVGDLPDYAVRPKTYKMPDGETEEYYYHHIEITDCKSICCSGGSGAGGVPLESELPGDGSVPAVQQSEVKKIKQAVAMDIIEYSRKNGVGSVPGSIIMWAESVAAPIKPDWKKCLESKIGKVSRTYSQGNSDTSFSRISKRSGDVITPGFIKYPIKINVLVDTSGSMANNGNIVFGYVKKITSSFDVSIYECDTQMRRIKNNRKIVFSGGGGTDLREPIRALDRRCDLIIVITDCETPWPSKTKTDLLIIRIGESQAPEWCDVIDAC